MEDSRKHGESKTKLLNPWMLNFQKLGLELKCPLCLSLFKRPMLLPCNHLFCNSCLDDCTTARSECAVCKAQYAQIDVRHVPFVENMVAIYRSLDATFCANLFQQRSSDDVRVLKPCQAFPKSTYCDKKAVKIPLNLPSSNEVGVCKNHKSNIAVYHKAEELDMCCGGGVDFCSAGKPNPTQSSLMEIGDREDCGVMEMDVNLVTQSAPGSSPFCDTKGSDIDCSDQDSEHPLPPERLEDYSLKRAGTGNGNLKKRMAQFRPESSASETEGLTRELKRQKNITFGDDHIQHSTTHHNKLVGSHSGQDVNFAKDPGAPMPANAPNDLYPSTSICSFCQSSKTSEVTGPMLHYANGSSVTGDAAMQPNVIHVHRICIDWAPQVYFVDEAIKNLKAEVARGAKLKCSKCGLKGAALGCYVKSCRRTYHVPCAMDISTCRWHHGDFLLLCPVHSNVRFPNEKSRPRKHSTEKHLASSQLPFQQLNPLEASQDDGQKLVFCGSALSTDEKVHLINFASRVGATVTKSWTSDVTHVIAATDANGACCRTLKVLMGILNGRWIVKMDWIKASMEAMNPVEEEPYEISLDNHGCYGGPKAGRLRALANEPKLFSGLKFYFSGDYVSIKKENLEDLVKGGGGSVLKSKDELEAKRHECEIASKLLVVYDPNPPQGCKLGDEVSIIWQRLNEADELAANTGYQVIDYTWILESIAAFKLQPFVS
ncbi:BRCA1-associated RING domain protein 1 [Gastrolobium bilobum]|uniref:BRCA1-associated RING domain protein 1 n=1 Tax=Gastrolobium bilobum TaxID=150636 RepID=UPI002AAFE691|nr:BRCA1-associated RING domain protein 1 [Gastrolobium bilobum]